jgi:hypothetical protein
MELIEKFNNRIDRLEISTNMTSDLVRETRTQETGALGDRQFGPGSVHEH